MRQRAWRGLASGGPSVVGATRAGPARTCSRASSCGRAARFWTPAPDRVARGLRRARRRAGRTPASGRPQDRGPIRTAAPCLKAILVAPNPVACGHHEEGKGVCVDELAGLRPWSRLALLRIRRHDLPHAPSASLATCWIGANGCRRPWMAPNLRWISCPESVCLPTGGILAETEGIEAVDRQCS